MKKKVIVIFYSLFISLTLHFTGCSGSVTPAEEPGTTTDPGTTTNPGETTDQGTTTNPGTTTDPGTTTNPGTTTDPGTTTNPGNTITSDPDVNFKYTRALCDYVVFDWDESKNAKLDYYIIEIKDKDKAQSIKISEKINKTGGHYKIQVRGVSTTASYYYGFLYGYDKDGNKLFQNYDIFSVLTGDLTAYNVIYNETSGQIEHTWNTSSYTSIAKINIYSAASENGEYSQIYSVDPGTFVRKYVMDTIETNKTVF